MTVDSQMCNAISPPPPFFGTFNLPKFQGSSTFGKIRPGAANQSHHFSMPFDDSHFCFIERQGEISAWPDKRVREPPRHPLITTDNEKNPLASKQQQIPSHFKSLADYLKQCPENVDFKLYYWVRTLELEALGRIHEDGKSISDAFINKSPISRQGRDLAKAAALAYCAEMPDVEPEMVTRHLDTLLRVGSCYGANQHLATNREVLSCVPARADRGRACKTPASASTARPAT